MKVSIQLDRRKKILTIQMPLEAARLSASGKTTLIASTRGVQTTDIAYRGRPVAIVANAFLFNEPKRRKPPRTAAIAEGQLEKNQSSSSEDK